MPSDTAALQSHFRCPRKACGKQLARRDVANNLSDSEEIMVEFIIAWLVQNNAVC